MGFVLPLPGEESNACEIFQRGCVGEKREGYGAERGGGVDGEPVSAGVEEVPGRGSHAFLSRAEGGGVGEIEGGGQGVERGWEGVVFLACEEG